MDRQIIQISSDNAFTEIANIDILGHSRRVVTVVSGEVMESE